MHRVVAVSVHLYHLRRVWDHCYVVFFGFVEFQLPPLSHFQGVGGHFYLISLRFVEFKMHPYHILKGSWLRLLNIFNVSGIQAAPLSHFGGVRVNCTCFFSRFVEFQVHPSRIFEGSNSTLQVCFEVCGIPGAPLSHFGGVRANFTTCFWGLWNSRCTPFAFWRGQGRFSLVFLRFVEFQVHPYRILEGSGSILLSVFEGCGVQSATLSHFDGLRIMFT